MCNDTGFFIEGLPTYPEKKKEAIDSPPCIIVPTCDWETLYRNECEVVADLKSDMKYYYERNQILKDENAYLKARNEKLEAIVRAVETLCGGKILDD